MKMAAVGDNCVDRYTEEGIAFPGGSCANVSVFARRLGIESAYVGVIGSDDSGALIRRALEEEDVDVSRVLSAEEPSSTTDIRVDGNGNRIFTGHVPATTRISLSDDDLAFLAQADWIHTGHSSASEHLLADLSTAATLVFDFSHKGFDYAAPLLPHVSVAAFSREELDSDECADLLSDAAARGPRIAIVTRGPRGAMVRIDGTLYSCPAEPIDVVDTMGAGDAFQTCFLASITRGEPVQEAMRRATLFAADVCTYRGAFGHETPLKRKDDRT